MVVYSYTVYVTASTGDPSRNDQNRTIDPFTLAYMVNRRAAFLGDVAVNDVDSVGLDSKGVFAMDSTSSVYHRCGPLRGFRYGARGIRRDHSTTQHKKKLSGRIVDTSAVVLLEKHVSGGQNYSGVPIGQRSIGGVLENLLSNRIHLIDPARRGGVSTSPMVSRISSRCVIYLPISSSSRISEVKISSPSATITSDMGYGSPR